MNRQSFRCSACGAVNTINKNEPTHVRILDRDDPSEIKGEFRLGNRFERSQQVQCINEAGQVARVCYFDKSLEAGSVVISSGDRLSFYRA